MTYSVDMVSTVLDYSFSMTSQCQCTLWWHKCSVFCWCDIINTVSLAFI